jgi:hypothetical protein
METSNSNRIIAFSDLDIGNKIEGYSLVSSFSSVVHDAVSTNCTNCAGDGDSGFSSVHDYIMSRIEALSLAPSVDKSKLAKFFATFDVEGIMNILYSNDYEKWVARANTILRTFLVHINGRGIALSSNPRISNTSVLTGIARSKIELKDGYDTMTTLFRENHISLSFLSAGITEMIQEVITPRTDVNANSIVEDGRRTIWSGSKMPVSIDQIRQMIGPDIANGINSFIIVVGGDSTKDALWNIESEQDFRDLCARYGITISIVRVLFRTEKGLCSVPSNAFLHGSIPTSTQTQPYLVVDELDSLDEFTSIIRQVAEENSSRAAIKVLIDFDHTVTKSSHKQCHGTIQDIIQHLVTSGALSYQEALDITFGVI